MNKAFFINGGAGRVLCAIPALEYYIKHTDPNVIIVTEGWTELFLMSKILRNNVYTPYHKGLFELLKDREIVTPEPYRLNAYFNQKCNLIQAFDMLINFDSPPEKIPTTKKFNLTIGKADSTVGKNLTEDIKMKLQKNKVVVFQPFGSGAKLSGNYIIDESGRSFEVEDIIKIIEHLNKNYGVILMSDLKIPYNGTLGVMTPENMNLLQWTGVISQADYFLGCDSVGQHLANALGKHSTVVVGSTFPENISYPENKLFKIEDLGKGKRVYSPIRITTDILIERHNEDIMKLDATKIEKIVEDIINTLGKNTMPMYQLPQQSTCACGGDCGNTK